nr:hypothetical protein Iba_chr07aCG0480 [Ipomoea batatas]
MEAPESIEHRQPPFWNRVNVARRVDWRQIRIEDNRAPHSDQLFEWRYQEDSGGIPAARGLQLEEVQLTLSNALLISFDPTKPLHGLDIFLSEVSDLISYAIRILSDISDPGQRLTGFSETNSGEKGLIRFCFSLGLNNVGSIDVCRAADQTKEIAQKEFYEEVFEFRVPSLEPELFCSFVSSNQVLVLKGSSVLYSPRVPIALTQIFQRKKLKRQIMGLNRNRQYRGMVEVDFWTNCWREPRVNESSNAKRIGKSSERRLRFGSPSRDPHTVGPNNEINVTRAPIRSSNQQESMGRLSRFAALLRACSGTSLGSAWAVLAPGQVALRVRQRWAVFAGSPAIAFSCGASRSMALKRRYRNQAESKPCLPPTRATRNAQPHPTGSPTSHDATQPFSHSYFALGLVFHPTSFNL